MGGGKIISQRKGRGVASATRLLIDISAGRSEKNGSGGGKETDTSPVGVGVGELSGGNAKKKNLLLDSEELWGQGG